MRQIALITVFLFVLSQCAFAASGGPGTNTTTNTSSTSTSTSNSTSTTTSNTTSTSYSSSTSTSYSTSWMADKYVGDIDLGYRVQGYAYETGYGSATVGWINYYYMNTRSGLELLTQGPNRAAWGDANAWNPHVYLPDRCYELTQSTSKSTVYGTVSAPQYNHTNTSTAVSNSNSYQTSQSTSQQTSQSTSQQTTVTSTDQEIKVGDFVIGINTVINTNVNTNTNTNVNTNTNTNVNTNINTNTNTNYDSVYQKLTANTHYDVYTVVQDQYVSPVVLDLSGTGKLDASEGQWLPHSGIQGKRMAMFDIRGNGFPMAMEWVGPKAGLLIEPKADGTVDGTCLFGQADGFSNGFQKLSLRDKNNDGILTGAELNGLCVWVDKNSNGKTDAGEIFTLGQLKITELGLHHNSYKSTFVMNGKPGTMWDWFPTCLDVRKVGSVAKK